MAQFSLPKNSKVQKGSYFKAEGASNIKKLKVYRWNPDMERIQEPTLTKLIWIIADQWYWML